MRAEGGSTRRLTHIVATNRSAIPRKTPPDELPPADAEALPPKKWKKGRGGVEACVSKPPGVVAGADGDDQAAGDSVPARKGDAGAGGAK